jgi:hypothetical protein
MLKNVYRVRIPVGATLVECDPEWHQSEEEEATTSRGRAGLLMWLRHPPHHTNSPLPFLEL